ncbi:hypothetical protein NTE19_003358 [Vibrio fluvialis]|nr:hypothetical protein [Vibrio fluvialis]
MQIVIVTNNSGIRLNHMGKRIKSLRDVKGDQQFSFKTCVEALAFEKFLNDHAAKGLKAVYSPAAEDLEKEGIVIKTEETGEGVISDEAIKALAAELEANNNKDALLALAAEMKLEDYESLNKGPLAELIATAQLTASEGGE